MLFRTKPGVPAIAKWTTCGASCRYFLLTCGYHNLMFRAFLDMRSVVETGACTLDNLEIGKHEATEMVSSVEIISDATDNNFYRKSLRIKSFKAFEWLQSEFTVYNLLTCTLVSQLLEKIMWTFMSWQHRETWLSLEDAPIIHMANSKTSPAVRSMNELSGMLRTSACSALCDVNVTIDELAEG